MPADDGLESVLESLLDSGGWFSGRIVVPVSLVAASATVVGDFGVFGREVVSEPHLDRRSWSSNRIVIPDLPVDSDNSVGDDA